jgi:hypothetical protein
MEAEKAEGKDKGKAMNSPQNGVKPLPKAKKPAKKQELKPLGKCASFVQALKDAKGKGLNWEEVAALPWNDNKAKYPMTFKKLLDAGEAHRTNKRMYYGKTPIEKKNGKAS